MKTNSTSDSPATVTSYAGIDYSGFSGANRNAETGIRFGVISQNGVMPEALDDIFTHGTDRAWETALADAIDHAKRELDHADWEASFDEDEIAQELSDSWETSLSNYEYDRDGYKLAGCGDFDLFVLQSPYFTHAQFCSPCVPGACNLDSPLDRAEPNNKCYCLGHDWFEGGIAPYPVYSIETGELVTSDRA